MPRRLVADQSAPLRDPPGLRPLRRLWRQFLTAALDRRALDLLSAHELRDIGLSDVARSQRDRRDRFRDLL